MRHLGNPLSDVGIAALLDVAAQWPNVQEHADLAVRLHTLGIPGSQHSHDSASLLP